MASYTEQLFESLKRAASPQRLREQEYTFNIPAVDSVTAASALSSDPYLSANGYEYEERHGKSSQPTSPATQLIHTVTSSPASGADGGMPQELEECYAVIRFQRAQITQLRGRATALEEQLQQYRDKVLNYELQGGLNTSVTLSARHQAEEVSRLKASVEQSQQEINKYKEERTVLMKKLLEQQRKAEETKISGERERQQDAVAATATSRGESSSAVSAPVSRSAGTVKKSVMPRNEDSHALPETKQDASATAVDHGALGQEPADDASSLLAKQEQARQQEMLLLSSRQQQAQQRILQMQQHRTMPQSQMYGGNWGGRPAPSPVTRFASSSPYGAGMSGGAAFGSGPNFGSHFGLPIASPGPAPFTSPSQAHFGQPPVTMTPLNPSSPYDTGGDLGAVQPENALGGYGTDFPGGSAWSVYNPPPPGVKWPESMPFFVPLINFGIPFIKHGRRGNPHKRTMWLDISVPSDPTLVWQEGPRDPERVKEKDRLRLVEIIEIRAGRIGDVLERSGKEEDADKYFTCKADSGNVKQSLDVEMPSQEARDWVFKKFADLFQAYASAQQEKLQDEAITMRVAQLIDGGGNQQMGAARGRTQHPSMRAIGMPPAMNRPTMMGGAQYGAGGGQLGYGVSPGRMPMSQSNYGGMMGGGASFGSPQGLGRSY